MIEAQHFKVAIIGGGPAAIGTAVGLARRRIGPVLLIERRAEAGGTPMGYRKKPGGVPTFVEWTRGRVVFGEELAGRMLDRLAKTDTKIRLDTQVTKIEPTRKRLTLLGPAGLSDITADAVVLAAGAREQTPAEKGWLAGARSSRVGFTRHLTGWLDQHGLCPLTKPVVVGSDLIAWSVAAKLRAAGSSEPVMIDHHDSPGAGLFERLYFQRWTRPDRVGNLSSAKVKGSRTASTVQAEEGREWICDGVMICGQLVPNTELALIGGLSVDLPSRQLQLTRGQTLSQPGWFAAGNVLGGFHGAQWCYFNGYRVASHVTRFLKAT